MKFAATVSALLIASASAYTAPTMTFSIGKFGKKKAAAPAKAKAAPGVRKLIEI